MREIGFTSKVFTPHSIVGQLSGGERQGVAIARAIYKQADLIILDEPTTALSLTETAKVFHFVRQVRASGRSILFIGHNIHHVFDIADRFVVIDRGKVALDRRPQPRSSRPRSSSTSWKTSRIPADCRAARRRRSGAGSTMSKTMEPDLHSPPASARRAARNEWKHPSDHWLRGFVLDNRASLGTLAVFVVMMAVFMVANPTVFTTWYLYSSVLTTLPVALFVVVPLVFVVTCGEIDLSFPATMGFASWVFALVVQAGYDPFLGIAAALVTGMLLGFLVGVAGRLWRAVVADRHARHELPAARPDPDHQRGQVDGADQPCRQLGLQDLLQPGLRHSGADLLGHRLRRAVARCSTTGIASARR